jgi:hypothetical protein
VGDVLVAVAALGAVVMTPLALGLLAAVFRDLRGYRPSAIDGVLLAEVVRGSRWPNAAWQWYETKRDIRSLRSESAQSLKYAGYTVSVVLGIGVLWVIWLLLPPLTTPVAVIVGACIIAHAIFATRR